jgi:hypothetical protein
MSSTTENTERVSEETTNTNNQFSKDFKKSLDNILINTGLNEELNKKNMIKIIKLIDDYYSPYRLFKQKPNNIAKKLIIELDKKKISYNLYLKKIFENILFHCLVKETTKISDDDVTNIKNIIEYFKKLGTGTGTGTGTGNEKLIDNISIYILDKIYLIHLNKKKNKDNYDRVKEILESIENKNLEENYNKIFSPPRPNGVASSGAVIPSVDGPSPGDVTLSGDLPSSHPPPNSTSHKLKIN